MSGNKGAVGWGHVKDLVKRGIKVSKKGEENTEEFAGIAKDIQKIAVLYGEELFDSIPVSSRKETLELFGVSSDKKQDSKETNKRQTERERRLLSKLVRCFYRSVATNLVYEEDTKHASLSTTRVRQRLCDLMGTDVIRLNDKSYFQKLTERLQDEYETTMDKQEEARASSEQERLHRLMLEGIINDPTDYRAVVQGHEKKQHKKKKRRKIKRHTYSHVTYDTKASDDEGQSKTRKEDVVTQVGILSDTESTPSKPPGSADDRSPSETRKKSVKKVSIDDKMHARPPHHESALRPLSSCSTHRKSRRVKSAAPRISHWEKEPFSSDDDDSSTSYTYDTQSLPEKLHNRKQSKYSTHEPERVSRLRNEETVAGLYSIAEELVSPVRVDDQPIRKVIIKAKPKKMTTSLKY